jgi:nicotinate-nucleotide adenylyltransferase
MTRILVFGGTFDPPHIAHTRLVEETMLHLECEKVLFVIAARSPFKETHEQTSSEHRLAMLKIALADSPWAEICTIELERGGTSYTIDTLEELQQIYGKSVALTLLIGEDQAESFCKWHRNDDIKNIANVALLSREGSFSDQFDSIPIKPIALSSTEIRTLVHQGKAIDGLVLPGVAAYITTHNLYR